MSLSSQEEKEVSRLQSALAVFLCFYFVAGLTTFFLFPSGKDKSFPPFFHWFLFALVPNEHFSTQYTVRLTAYQDVPLVQPELFGDADDIITEAKANRARDGIRRLGNALAQGNVRAAEEIRASIETAYFPSKLAYEVVKITYNPLERFATGKLEKIDVLGSYETK